VIKVSHSFLIGMQMVLLQAFREAIKNANGNLPDTIHIDLTGHIDKAFLRRLQKKIYYQL
jgi:hypothetical protein